MDNGLVVIDTERIKRYPYTRRLVEGCPFLHTHTFWEICYVLNGTMENLYRGKKAVYEFSKVAIIRPSDVHRYGEQSKDLDYRDIYVDCDTMKKVCKSFSSDTFDLYEELLNASEPICFEVDAAHINSIEKSASAFDGITRKKETIDSSFERLIGRILSFYLDGRVNIEESSNVPAYFTDILKYIDRNPIKADCETVIKKMNYSRSHVSRLFMKYLGVSLQEYIIQAKMSRAADLILYKEYKIVYIATLIGYSSQNSFIKAFKKYYNCSPTQYRKEKYIKISEKE